jgi:hypothetical protein
LQTAAPKDLIVALTESHDEFRKIPVRKPGSRPLIGVVRREFPHIVLNSSHFRKKE